jgi:hypothetical protein
MRGTSVLRLRDAVIVTTVLLAGSPANAAHIDYLTIASLATISITGEIVAGDSASLKSAMARAADAGYPAAEIMLNSIGGNVYEGVKIARLVHGAKMNTNVAFGAICASVCFLAFAAGAKKTADLAARIGVHSASGELGEETPASIAGTQAMARIAQTLSVPRAIIEQMLSTPASQVYWLGTTDLAAMGAIIRGRG